MILTGWSQFWFETSNLEQKDYELGDGFECGQLSGKKSLMGLMGVGSSVFGAWFNLGAESQDTADLAGSVLASSFSNLFLTNLNLTKMWKCNT